jgi:hypothetical protein
MAAERLPLRAAGACASAAPVRSAPACLQARQTLHRYTTAARRRRGKRHSAAGWLRLQVSTARGQNGSDRDNSESHGANPLAHQHSGSSRDAVTAQINRMQRLLADHPGGRIEAQRFCKDLMCIGQALQVSRGGQVPARCAIQLDMQAFFDLGVLCQQIPSPGQGAAGPAAAHSIE